LSLELHVVEVESLDWRGVESNARNVLLPSVDTLFCQVKRAASIRQKWVSSRIGIGVKTIQNFENSVRVVVARDGLDSACLGRVGGSSVDAHFRVSRAGKATFKERCYMVTIQDSITRKVIVIGTGCLRREVEVVNRTAVGRFPSINELLNSLLGGQTS
jgi:hypothetical protein